MTQYAVTVRRILTTDILIEAENAAAARRRVEEYGPDLAMVDFENVRDHAERCKIISVRQE